MVCKTTINSQNRKQENTQKKQKNKITELTLCVLKIKYAFFIFSIKEVNFSMKNRTAIGIVCIILAVAVTFVVSPLVNNISDKKTEVVRFVADVSHGTEIKDTDAGPELKHELDITAADMHSGNNEIAITRLEARVGSPLMSDVCRGLISINRGDVNTVYWKSLSMKFADIQRQQLRIKAEKIPKKVKKLSMCLLFCFMLIYIVVILAQIVSSMGVLFG